MDYFEHMQARLNGLEDGVPAHLNAKLATRPFANAIGVQTSEISCEFRPSDIPFGEFPEEFVLKPTFASTSIGVHLLRRVNEDAFLDLVSGHQLSIKDLVVSCEKVSNRYYDDPNVGTFVFEELLYDLLGNTPPDDIRVYAFQGEIGLVNIESHTEGVTESAYFNPDFSPMTDCHERFNVHPKVQHLEKIVFREAPSNSSDLLNVAKRISVSIPTAFLRVDLFNSSKGIILGELTLFPGTFYFKNRKLMGEADAKRLGAMWDESVERLRGSLLEKATGSRPTL